MPCIHNTTYTFTMPAKNVSVSAVFEENKYDVTYDFDKNGTADLFTAGGSGVQVTAELASTDPSSEGDKSLKFAQTGSSHTTTGIRTLDLTEELKTAKKVKIEFDTYMVNGGRAHFGVSDANDESLFWYGQTGSSGYSYKTVGMDNQLGVDHGAQMVGQWNHTTIDVDYTTGKMKVTVAPKAGGQATLGEREANLGIYRLAKIYYDDYNNGTSYIDNIKVSAELGDAQDVTVKYVDKDSNADVKTSETIAWVKGLPFNATDTMKANFEDQSPRTKRYIYQTEGSTASIAAVSAEEHEVTLKFQTVEYVTVTFTAKVDSTATKDIPIKITGTAACDTAVTENETLTTTDDGTVSLNLLPGAEPGYTYTVDVKPGEYKAKSDTFNTDTPAVEIPLDKDVQALAAVDIDARLLNTGVQSGGEEDKVIGYLSTYQYSDDSKTMEMVNYTDPEWTVTEGTSSELEITKDETFDPDGKTYKVTLKANAESSQYKVKAAAGGKESAEITIAVNSTGTGTENINSATESFTANRNIFNAPSVSDTNYNTYGVYTKPIGWNRNVLVMGRDDKEATAKFAPVKIGEGKITFTTEFWDAWGNANAADSQVIQLLTSDSKVVAELKIAQNSGKFDVQLGGAAATDESKIMSAEETAKVLWSGSSGRNNSNGWIDRPYLEAEGARMTLTIEKDGSATMQLENKNHYTDYKFTGSVTGNIDKATYADIAELKLIDKTGVSGNSAKNGFSLSVGSVATTVEYTAD